METPRYRRQVMLVIPFPMKHLAGHADRCGRSTVCNLSLAAAHIVLTLQPKQSAWFGSLDWHRAAAKPPFYRWASVASLIYERRAGAKTLPHASIRRSVKSGRISLHDAAHVRVQVS